MNFSKLRSLINNLSKKKPLIVANPWTGTSESFIESSSNRWIMPIVVTLFFVSLLSLLYPLYMVNGFNDALRNPALPVLERWKIQGSLEWWIFASTLSKYLSVTLIVGAVALIVKQFLHIKNASKIDPESFQAFTANTLASTAHKMVSVKMPSLGKHRLFRKAMRITAAGLVFMYSVVFFFSFGNAICLLFLATDIVLLYMLWLSRR